MAYSQKFPPHSSKATIKRSEFPEHLLLLWRKPPERIPSLLWLRASKANLDSCWSLEINRWRHWESRICNRTHSILYLQLFFFSLAMQFLGEWLHARQHPDPPSSVQQSSSRPWTKPQLGSIKVNTDATMFHNQHHYGTNICIRNDQGQFSKSKDNLHVEFTSTSRGISYGSLSSFILGNWNECV